jgi:hypothetical protein
MAGKNKLMGIMITAVDRTGNESQLAKGNLPI